MSAGERRALNENVFHEMNERLEQLGEEFGYDTVEFLRECADPACSAALSIPVSVYEAVRDYGRRFLIVPGHEGEGVEGVVEEHPGYLVVEKLDEAGEVASTTTSTGRTALCASCHQTAAPQRRSKRLLAYAGAIFLADSSTNTRPPEFANPTGC